MMNDEWLSEANHIAVNPRAPTAADGLSSFADGHGLRGLCFFQTSGSEGLPKWVGLAKDAFLVSARSVNAHFEIGGEDHWLIALPLHHVGGFAIQARAWLSGSKVTRIEDLKWEPRRFAAVCDQHWITLTSLVPTQVYDLVQARAVCPSAVRVVMVGGGGLSQGLADAAAELGWPVFQTYGMTEAASQIAAQPYNSFGALFDVTSLEVLPHWQVATDAQERLILRGPALAKGYAVRRGDGEWSWEAIDAGAGLRTRDRVRLWLHGARQYLRFVGRESGQVKILGELVHLAPLQQLLENLARQLGWRSLPALVALPDARRDSRLVLVVEEGQGNAQSLLAQYQAQSTPLCEVSEVRMVASIPRSDLGKVEMPKLLEIIGEKPDPK